MSETSAPTHARIDPRQIIISRETRQRQENIADVEDLMQSIKAIGLINPIVVRTTAEGPMLVAGERRLQASLKLGLNEVDVRFFENLSPEEAEVIELEENIKRKELAWRDQVKAVGRIHGLYRKRDTHWRIEQTAESLSIHPSYLRRILHVHGALASGRIDKAENVEQAYNTLARFAERAAESIVGDIIVNGAALFGNAEQMAVGAGGTTNITTADFTTVSAVSVASEELTIAYIDEANEVPQDAWNELKPSPVAVAPSPPPAPTLPLDPVLCANFVEWIKTYNGPKFTFIHCDFPYGNYRGGDSQGALGALETEEFYDNTESVYWTLLDALTSGLDNIMSYSAHLVFWFNMNFYTETVKRLRSKGLMVHDHPLIWHKTGGPGGLGVVPGTAVTYPRRTYDTALIAVRGNRPLAKPGMNSYAAPTVGNKIHPSQKSEPMLRHFFSMFVDETTSMLDPTCGSAASLRAAEDLGAKSVLGLELDPNYAKAANTRTLQARVLRQAGQLRREE